MTPHPQQHNAAIKVGVEPPKPTTKCPTMYGVIDMVTVPWLAARSGARRGYCDTLTEFQGIDFQVESAWVRADKKEVNWEAVKRRAKAMPRVAIVGIDIESPWDHDVRKYDPAWPMRALDSRNLICKVIATMKSVRPDLIIGAYAAIPNMFWESHDAAALKKWQDAAKFCQPIIDASDIVMPESYLHYDQDDDNDSRDIASDAFNIDNEVGEAIKLSGGKPVVPWVSAKIYDRDMVKSRDVSPVRWRAQQERLKALGCNGVAMWGYNNGLNPGIHELVLLDDAIRVWGGRVAA